MCKKAHTKNQVNNTIVSNTHYKLNCDTNSESILFLDTYLYFLQYHIILREKVQNT